MQTAIHNDNQRIHPPLFIPIGLRPNKKASSTIRSHGSFVDIPTITSHHSWKWHTLLVKEFLDIIGAFLILLFTLPLMASIAVAIKLSSAGPVFYRSRRVGRCGEVFTCYKFRTMIVDAEHYQEVLRKQNERSGPFFKIANDPRVTQFGRFLRKFSLDELPQLWNVLRGDMSLVGPRPHPLDDVLRYQSEHLRRLDVTPGMTGLWQVTARRDPSFHTNMVLDLQYINNRSLWLDLKILAKTVSAVLEGTGS